MNIEDRSQGSFYIPRKGLKGHAPAYMVMFYQVGDSCIQHGFVEFRLLFHECIKEHYT